MSDTPADQHRDGELLARLSRTAAGIFARYGVDFALARRAGGWTNLTWRGGGFFLRVAVHPGTDKIGREVKLAALLPPEVGYPPLIEYGVTEGFEWSLAKDLAGVSLDKAWQGLGWEERCRALVQLWQKAQAVHTVDISKVGELASRKAWFNATDAVEASACLRRLAAQGILKKQQATSLEESLDRFWQVLPGADIVLNHGDLTLANALWQNGEIVSLLDFEFAVIAPAELDLNGLVKIAFPPDGMVEGGLEPLQHAVTRLAQPVLAHAGGGDLLCGYAILLELCLLEDWLAHPEGEGPLKSWEPYRRLVSLVDGQHGYLAPLITSFK